MARCDFHYDSGGKCHETATYSPPGRKPMCFSHYSQLIQWPNNGKPQVDESVLEEAQKLIYGDRQDQYGNAKTNFGDIAHLWAPIVGKNIGPEAVALCLLQLKVARAINDVRADKPIKRDTVVDLAGYAGCIEKIQKGV